MRSWHNVRELRWEKISILQASELARAEGMSDNTTPEVLILSSELQRYTSAENQNQDLPGQASQSFVFTPYTALCHVPSSTSILTGSDESWNVTRWLSPGCWRLRHLLRAQSWTRKIDKLPRQAVTADWLHDPGYFVRWAEGCKRDFLWLSESGWLGKLFGYFASAANILW